LLCLSAPAGTDVAFQAGLFSAAVTAFCSDAFQALSQNSSDTTNALLFAISQQLANSTTPSAASLALESFAPAKHNVQINVFYFVSLVLALSVSAVCILAKQWIREYQRDPPVSVQDAVRIRQMRFDSLEKWQVPQIIASLPVIILVALVLFFAGLLIQLWHVTEQTTARAVSVVVGFTGLFILFTTIVPA